MIHSVFRTIERSILWVEEIPMSVHGWISAFVGVLFIRFVLEGFSSRQVSGFVVSDFPTNLHYALFYLAVSLATSLLLSAWTETSVTKTIRLALFALPLIWLAPIIDLALSGGAHMTYLFVSPRAFIIDLLTYFGPLYPSGITLGMRIEIAIILLAAFQYVHLKTRSWGKSVLGVVSLYGVIYLSAALPSALVLFSGTSELASIQWWRIVYQSLLAHSAFHPSEIYDPVRTFELLFSFAMAQYLYLIVVILGILCLWKGAPRILVAVLRNIRIPRLAHFLMLFVAGGLLATHLSETVHLWTFLDLVTTLVGVCSLVFVWIFSVATNDLADASIDCISNTSRPLVTGVLTREEMRDVAIVSGLFAIIAALTLGSYSLYFVLVFIAAYFIYSMPPLRLKRFPVVAPLLISIAFLMVTLLGFFLVSIDRTLSAFPGRYALLIIFAYALGLHMKDLKDIDGDKAEGIMTIPVMFGDRLGRMVIGGMIFLAFLLVPVFFSSMFFLPPCFLAGTILWVGIVRGAGERLVFLVYFVTMIVLAALFFWG